MVRKSSKRAQSVFTSASGPTASSHRRPVFRNSLTGLGHLFEVQEDIVLYNSSYRPGCIRSAKTWTKLSSLRDPNRYQDYDVLPVVPSSPTRSVSVTARGGGCGDVLLGVPTSDLPLAAEDDDVNDLFGLESGTEDGESEDKDGWKWEPEEDFTLGQVWPKGGDLTKGITYHHDASTQIHITINQTKIPARKGINNKPHVFTARGLVFLAPLSDFRLPPSLGDDEEPEEEDEYEYEEDVNVQLRAEEWNRYDAFGKFLAKVEVIEKAGRGQSPDLDAADVEGEEEEEVHTLSTPGLSSSFSSSPFRSSCSAASASSSVFLPTPLNLPTKTPFPTHPLHRSRVRKAHRKLARLTMKGMGELKALYSDADDEGGVEVDELAEEDAEVKVEESGREGEENKWPTPCDRRKKLKPRSKVKAKQVTMTRPPNWDPFVDTDEEV